MPRLTQPKPGEPIKVVVTKDGRQRYQATVTTSAPGAAKRTQARRNFDTLKQARAFVEETRSAVRQGTFQARSDMTVSQLCDLWLSVRGADVLSGDLRAVTLQGYAHWLDPVRRHMGERRLSDVRVSDVEAFKAWALREGQKNTKRPTPMGPRAVAGSLGVLQQAFDLAVRDRLVLANPVTPVRRPRATSSNADKVWTVPQLAAFLGQVDQDRTEGRLTLAEAVAMRLAACAMRLSEVKGLTWGAVDFETGRVAVVHGRIGTGATLTAPKSRRSRRWVPVDMLAPGTGTLLKELWLVAGRPAAGQVVGELRGHGAPVRPPVTGAEQLVVVDAAGRPIANEQMRRIFEQTAARAGLPRINLHGTRHTVATALAGDPLVSDIDAAAILGDDVATFHSTYAQNSDDGMRRAAEAFAARMSQAMAPAL